MMSTLNSSVGCESETFLKHKGEHISGHTSCGAIVVQIKILIIVAQYIKSQSNTVFKLSFFDSCIDFHYTHFLSINSPYTVYNVVECREVVGTTLTQSINLWTCFNFVSKCVWQLLGQLELHSIGAVCSTLHVF